MTELDSVLEDTFNSDVHGDSGNKWWVGWWKEGVKQWDRCRKFNANINSTSTRSLCSSDHLFVSNDDRRWTRMNPYWKLYAVNMVKSGWTVSIILGIISKKKFPERIIGKFWSTYNKQPSDIIYLFYCAKITHDYL